MNEVKKTVEFSYKAEFASQVINEIPFGYINKTVCGCGLTTVALENNIPTIIAVPTIYLATNKAEQYPNKRFKGNILSVWGETTLSNINEYINNTKLPKILCTYDAIPKIKHLLETGKYRFIIDECNEIRKLYKSSRHNAATELFKVAFNYKDITSFISATPLDVKYLPDWISTIPQVKMIWENTIKASPILFKRTYPFKSLISEILLPLKVNNSLTVANKTFSSVIVFINSVEKIKEVIKSSGLNQNDCRIICGDSMKNDVKICGIKRYNPNDECKYLFITASGFCGIDIYMKNAMTVVISNTAKNWQMVDLLTDLKQAVSRQRDKSNANYGSYIYIYNQSVFSKSEEELLAELESIKDGIRNGIDLYNYAVDNDKLSGFSSSNDFIAYTQLDGNYRILDESAFKADLYFILETRKQYTKGFDLTTSLENFEEIKPIEVELETIDYKDLVNHFRLNNVDGKINWDKYSNKTEWITLIESSYKFYKTTWMNVTEAKQMVDNYGDDFELMKIQIKKMFNVGKTYSRKEVKEKLQAFYNSVGLKRKAKHTDLMEVMTVREKMIKGERLIEIINK